MGQQRMGKQMAGRMGSAMVMIARFRLHPE
jgi:hypothetical protein